MQTNITNHTANRSLANKMAFAKGMLPHHQGAVAMAEVQLKYGKNDQMRQLAQDIIKAQKSEIDLMQDWIKQHF